MERKFKSLLKNANKALSNLKLNEDKLSIFFQPYFDEEIAVLYQESDGFVILHNKDVEDKSYANLNTGVKEVFETIQKDENFYKNQRR